MFWTKYWPDEERVEYGEFLSAICVEYSLDPNTDIFWLRGTSIGKISEEEMFVNLLLNTGGLYMRVLEGADGEYMYRQHFEWIDKRIKLTEENITKLRDCILPMYKRRLILLILLLLSAGVGVAIVLFIMNSDSSKNSRVPGSAIGAFVAFIFITIPFYFLRKLDSKKLKQAKNQIVGSNMV